MSSRASLRDFRVTVAEAISELRSQEVRSTYAAITLPELAEQHLKALSNPSGPRLGRLERINAIRNNLKTKLDTIKAIDPEVFRIPDPKRDANT